MPRFTPVHHGLKRLPVDCDTQVLPGRFEHALCYLIDHTLDLTAFHARDTNDDEGAAAVDPAVLLKIILLAYSRGIVSSRKIDAVCRETVVCIAAAGDSQPHVATLAAFVSARGDLAAQIFAQVLVICARQGLIGREMFAIDGVKLTSNASQAKRGSRKDGQRQAAKMENAARKMLDTHRDADAASQGESDAERDAKRRERRHKEARHIRDWLATHPEERKGSRGGVRLSHRTDNESAKTATAKGVIQGDTGVAAVDEKNQVIVEAQAHGTGSEQAQLVPVVEATAMLRTPATVMTAEAGSHSEDKLRELAGKMGEAYLCDHGYRRRDACDAGQAQHKEKPDPRWDRCPQEKQPKRFGPADVRLAADGSHGTVNGDAAIKCRGAERDGVPCTLRVQCLRTPEKTKTRQVACFQGKREGDESHTDRMKATIDTALGRQLIARRVATVEPVFGNLRHHTRLDRFTRWSRAPVDGPWQLYGLTHNLEKLASHGYGR